MKKDRIGVFGGTFDPVHKGHFQLAKHAQNEVNLSQVLFVPAAQPPHKYRVFTSFPHRLRMLELHCAGSKDLHCSDIEQSLPKPSYTVDTVAALKSIFPQADLHFILGADAFLDLMTWKAYPEILTKIKFVISPRVGYQEAELHNFLGNLGYVSRGNVWSCSGDKMDIFLLSAIPIEVSSQEIRDLLVTGGKVDQLLHPDVLDYIKQNRLYCRKNIAAVDYKSPTVRG